LPCLVSSLCLFASARILRPLNPVFVRLWLRLLPVSGGRRILLSGGGGASRPFF
jgi:hypothetical protein